jgi:hypothetical protein
MTSQAGIMKPRPDYNSTWPYYLCSGRNKATWAGIKEPDRNIRPRPT